MTPSKYQKAIYLAFQKTKRNLNISAVAGSGKTTTLLELLRFVPTSKQCLFLAFNKSIVEELKKRTENKRAQILTVHSCGWRAILIRYGSRVKMNPNKVIAKTEIVLDQMKIDKKRYGYFFYTIPKLIDLMRCNLLENTVDDIRELSMRYDVDIDDEDIPIVQRVFKLVVGDRHMFDFMDMIYVPVVDPSVRLKKYDIVFCDESQDFSICQQEFIRRCINRAGRLITVGDEKQAIYGFAGADSNSYQRLGNINGEAIKLPLSVCYRCSKRVVEEAQRIVPEIQYAENAEDGDVRTGSLTMIQDGDWVLCRNLKPLVQTYLWLIKNKMKCKIRGKDIAENIVNLIKKTGARTLDGLMNALGTERDKLFEKLTKKGVRQPSKHPKMELLEQKTDVILALSEEVQTVDGLVRMLENIFSDDTEGILLSTIHKAKGLENDRIFFICPELIPSKYATQDWQFVQENNLKYVAITRAKKELIYVPQSVFDGDVVQVLSKS